MAITGLPQPSDLAGSGSYLDGLASTFKADWANRGRNQTGEAGTVAVKAYSAFTTAAPELPSSAMAQQGLANFAMDAQYDRHYTRLSQQILLPLEQQIGNNLKGTWQYVVSGGCQTNLDAHLLRLNACHPGVLVALSGTLSLTAAYASSGNLRTCTSASCPYVVVTAVGTQDYHESVIGSTTSQIAISSSNNALRLAISGNVPATAPGKVRIYRTVYGGASTGPYYWDQDVVVTTAAGSAWPTIVATLVNSDAQLATDRQPPKFGCCFQPPETAFLFADAFSSPPAIIPGNAYTPGSVTLVSSRMLNPFNVALNPSVLATTLALGFNGLGNTAAIGATLDTPLGALATGGVLGVSVLGTGFTAGAILQTNNAPLGLQGFAGAFGGAGTATFTIQARAIVALNGTRTPTISYTYYDYAHPGSNVQTATGLVGTAFSGSITNEIQTFTIPAGRLVTGITAESATGTASTGTVVYEGVPVRSI